MAQQKKRNPLFISNLRIMAEVVGVVLVWRGIWDLTDRYLFPNLPDLSDAVSIVLGLLILFWENKNLKELK